VSFCFFGSRLAFEHFGRPSHKNYAKNNMAETITFEITAAPVSGNEINFHDFED
jgi:hypothetical protein